MRALGPRTLFYNSGQPSWLGRIDIRIRGIALILIQMALWVGPPLTLSLLLIVVMVLYGSCRHSLGRALRALRLLVWLALLVPIISVLQHREAYYQLFSQSLALSSEAWSSLIRAISYAGRLILSALLANLFLATATSGEIINGLEWLLRPLHNRGRALALACMLAITFADRYLSALWNIRAALWCRRLTARRAPLQAIRSYGFLLTRAIVIQVNTLAQSLYLRRYGNSRSLPHFQQRRSDWWIVIASALLLALSFVSR